jgi:hypothetical protein
MPFRHLKPGRFDLDTLKLMQQAFDTVCAKLQMDEGDSRRLTLANEIIRLAAEGTREQLTEQAEAALAVRRTGWHVRLAPKPTLLLV